jgi:microcystin-dependent protein
MTANSEENTAAAVKAKYGGEWTAWGAGRVPVGMNTSGTFNTLEKTGGAETHTLQTSEMPSHTHTGPSHSHPMPHTHTGPSHNHSFTGTAHTHNLHSVAEVGAGSIGNAGTLLNGSVDGLNPQARISSTTAGGTVGYAGTNNTGPASNSTTSSDGTGNTGNTGLGNAHNNLQPYITCYMYKRTA